MGETTMGLRSYVVGECAGYVSAMRGVGGKWTCGEKSGPGPREAGKGSAGERNGEESRFRIGWGRRERVCVIMKWPARWYGESRKGGLRREMMGEGEMVSRIGLWAEGPG